MRKGLIYAALILISIATPKEQVELGKLRPVQTLYAYYNEGELSLVTDMGDCGRGPDVDAAVVSLREHAPGFIYLDTADYLIVGLGDEKVIPTLAEYLKGTVRICATEGVGELGEATEYLSAHKPKTKLADWTNEQELDVLRRSKEGYWLVKK